MRKLYIANKNYSSWSLRPWLAMQEAAVPFEEVLLPFGETPAWRDFRTKCPSGKVPCLESEGEWVWESLAIVETLAEDYPALWPEAPKARAWARAAAAEMHAGFQTLRNTCSMSIGVRVQLHTHSPALRDDLERMSSLLSLGLSRFGGPFLTGSRFCAADAFFGPIAFRMQTFGLRFAPPAQAYLTRLLGLPAMQAWERAALQERFREPTHEADTLAHGVLLEDLRAPALGPT